MDKIREEFEKWYYEQPDRLYSKTGLELSFAVGYNTRKPDPWDMVPAVPIKTGHHIRKLSFDPGRNHWQINEYFGTTIEDKIGCMVVAGYNCDVSRDGETRVYRDGKWIDE